MANPAWKPGVSGNPSGKSRMKLLSDDLRRMLTQSPTRVRAITEKLVTMAEEGDLTAIQMVFDRLEGKPHQSIEIDQTFTNLTREQRFSRLLELQAKLVSDAKVPAAVPVPVKHLDLDKANGSGNVN